MKFKNCIMVLSVLIVSLLNITCVHGFEYRKTLDMEVLDAMKLVLAQTGTLDWYSIFNLTAEADKKDITRAHRYYSRDFHPDKLKVSPEEHEKLVARYESVQEAVRILKDEVLRPRYDYFLKHGIPIWERKTKLTQNAINNNKAADKYPLKSEIVPIKEILERVDKLDRFKVIFLFEEPELVQKASVSKIKIVKFFNYLSVKRVNKTNTEATKQL
ncbi:hypothetical protein BB561_005663 [Smittium simulii]|uniref:J domain-containing protein n=1 Tax=Smittium simulii TaxID=133385 RepID=A0A2T9Y969_9FUNG|nr:hypothetical protein BB561_005663 [Smittium simulii]